MMRASMLAIGCAIVTVCGCASTNWSSSHTELLWPAAICGAITGSLAICIEKDLDGTPGVPDDEKSELRDGVNLLRALAADLQAEVVRCNGRLNAGVEVDLATVNSMTAEVSAQHESVGREWFAWRARHGLGKLTGDCEFFEAPESGSTP